MRAGCLLVACLAFVAAPAQAEPPVAPVFWVPVVVPAWIQPGWAVSPPALYWPVYVPASSGSWLDTVEVPAPPLVAKPAELASSPAPSNDVVEGAATSTEARSDPPARAPVARPKPKPKRKPVVKAVPKSPHPPRKLCWRDHELMPCP